MEREYIYRGRGECEWAERNPDWRAGKQDRRVEGSENREMWKRNLEYLKYHDRDENGLMQQYCARMGSRD